MSSFNKMFRRVRSHERSHRVLNAATPNVRKELLHHCDKELIKCLCECAQNVLKGNVPLTLSQKQKLCRHKHNLRELASKKVSKKKKTAILQKGGFLGALLTPIISLLGGLFT